MKLRGTCIACKRIKWFVSQRTYTIPKRILKEQPELSSLNGMTSNGDLCKKCFTDIKKATNII